MSGESEDPYDSIRSCIVFSPEDYGADKRKAWLYGIIIGWDAAALAELQQKFRWDDETVERLRRLRSKYTAEHPPIYDRPGKSVLGPKDPIEALAQLIEATDTKVYFRRSHATLAGHCEHSFPMAAFCSQCANPKDKK